MAMVAHDQLAQPEVADAVHGSEDQKDDDDVHMIALEVQRGTGQVDKSLAMVEVTAVKFRALVETPEVVHQAHRESVQRALETQSKEFTEYVNLLRAQYVHLGESASRALSEAQGRLANGDATLRDAQARIVAGTRELHENIEGRRKLEHEKEELRRQVHDLTEVLRNRDATIEEGQRTVATLQAEVGAWRNTAENCKEALKSAGGLQEEVRRVTEELAVARAERESLREALEEATTAGRRNLSDYASLLFLRLKFIALLMDE